MGRFTKAIVLGFIAMVSTSLGFTPVGRGTLSPPAVSSIASLGLTKSWILQNGNSRQSIRVKMSEGEAAAVPTAKKGFLEKVRVYSAFFHITGN